MINPERPSAILAEFAQKLEYDDLSTAVLDRAKMCILDWLAVTVAGSRTTESRIAAAIIKEKGGKPQATLVGHSERANCPDAALVNGTSAHSLDYDDEIHVCAIHPGSVIASTAFPVAESTRKGGKELLLSIVIGYESMARIGLAINPPPDLPHTARGFHPTATCGVFGSALVASRLMRLDLQEITDALGIAGSFSSGLGEYRSSGAMTKRIHPGKAAHDGILAALLARHGFTGPATVFEGRDGFLKAYGSKADAGKLTEGLGSTFHILEVSTKFHSCCYQCQSSVDALLEIDAKHHLRPEKIDRIIARLPSMAHYIVAEPFEQKYSPTTRLQAQTSLPYCLAIAAIEKKVLLDQFSPDKFHNAQVLSLARRVQTIKDEALDQACAAGQAPATVQVCLRDGTEFSSHVDYPRGSPDRPLSEAEFSQKFDALLEPHISPETTRELWKLVKGIENLGDVSEIVEMAADID